MRGSYSSWTNVLSGVPQGTLLGPILFLIYKNDINNSIESEIRPFADDSKIYRTLENQNDTTILQGDL